AVAGLDAAPPARPDGPARGRPRVLLVRASGDAGGPRGDGAVPHAPAADCRLPAAPPGEAAGAAEAAAPRAAVEPIRQAVGQARSDRRLAQTAAAAGVDDGRAVRVAAGDVAGAGGAIPTAAAGATHRLRDHRHDAAGPGPLPQGEGHRVVSGTVAGRDPP